MVALIMAGALLAYFVLIVVLAGFSYKWRGTKQWIAIALLLGIVMLPTWDIPIDRYRFNQLCKREAGIFVYEKVDLPSEFYLMPGEVTKKIIYLEDGASVLRSVKATGDELNMDALKKRYIVDDSFEESITNWGKVSRFTTTVSDGDKILGKSVSLLGGAGWFSERFNIGPSRPGIDCPKIIREPGYVPIEEEVIREIFQKIES